MASTEPAAARMNPVLIVLGAIAIFLAVIGSFAAYFLWPRGQRIGVIDLRAEAPSLSVDLEPGDRLSFRIEVITVGTKHGYPDSSRSRSNAVHDELEASTIALTLAHDGKPVASTQCRAFDGKATTGSSTASDVTSSGLPLRCALKASATGKHTLSASAAWVPKYIHEAKLEVRRERASD